MAGLLGDLRHLKLYVAQDPPSRLQIRLRLLYVASGIYYSPIAMPDWVREALAWNPILQGIEFFRSGFFPQYEPHWLNPSYLVTWAVAAIGLGFGLERALRVRMVVYT